MKTMRKTIFILSLILFLYAIIQKNKINIQKQAIRQQAQQYQSQIKETTTQAMIQEIKNSIGWLQISQTESINMPVMQNEENDFYLEHDAYGNPNIMGAAFLEAGISLNQNHLIIHGHSSHEPLMFTELKYYLDQEYVEAYPTFIFYDRNHKYLCEIVSVYSFQPVDLSHYAYDLNEQEYAFYLDMIDKFSQVKTSVSMNEKDRLITLSTCDMRDTSYRILVHAKMTEI